MIMVLPSLTWSASPKPCEQQSKFKDLQQKLENSDGIGAWQKIAKELQERITVLQARNLSMDEQQVELSCGYYLLAQSYFYLSAHIQKEAFYSYKVITSLYQSESYQPGLLKDEQARQRLDEAWDRLALFFKKDAWLHQNTKALVKSYGPSVFNQSQKLYLLEIQAIKPFDLEITLPPELQKEWPNRCGLSLECQKPFAFSFKLQANQSLVLPIKPGKYELSLSGNCVKTPILQSREFPSTQLFELPPMHCKSLIEVRDDLSQQLLEELWVNGEKSSGSFDALESSELEIKHPAYQATKIKAPEDGSKQTLNLKRCELDVKWLVNPKDAELNAPSKMPWGVTQQYQASRAGYLTQKAEFSLAQPKTCEEQVIQEVELSRAFEVEAFDQDHKKINQYALQLGSLPILSLEKGSNEGLEQKETVPLQRRVGKYPFEANSQQYQPIYGELIIPPCDQKLCTNPKLSLLFMPKEASRIDTLTTIKLSALLTTTLGVIVGGFAYGNYSDYQDHLSQSTYEASKDQRMQIDQQKNISLALVGVGLSTLAASYLWPLFSQSKDEKNDE